MPHSLLRTIAASKRPRGRVSAVPSGHARRSRRALALFGGNFRGNLSFVIVNIESDQSPTEGLCLPLSATRSKVEHRLAAWK
jgi:hypothetical protein